MANAAGIMAKRRTGALVAIENSTGLEDYIEAGVRLDAVVSSPLLISIFQVSGPLHDGAVIIQGNRARAARCMLPLAKDTETGKRLARAIWQPWAFPAKPTRWWWWSAKSGAR